MNNKQYPDSSKDNISDPSSRNYAKKVKSKANEKSPYGADEPSPHTTHNL